MTLSAWDLCFPSIFEDIGDYGPPQPRLLETRRAGEIQERERDRERDRDRDRAGERESETGASGTGARRREEEAQLL